MDGSSVSSSGPDPDRVLLLGSGPSVGFGVRSLDLALGGQLARALAALTERGADVDVLARTSLPVASVGRMLADARLWRYDAVVVTLGQEDALRLIPLPEWEDLMASLLRLLASSTASSTRIVVAGVCSISSLCGVDPTFGALVDVHARRMNRVTRRLCDVFGRATYIELGAPAMPSPERNGGSPAMYEEWARLLAPAVAATLPPTALADKASSARRLRDRPDDEVARQHAVDLIRSADVVDAPALERITRLARTLLGTSYAAITLVDGDRQEPLAQDGGRRPGLERALSLCAETIRGSGALQVPDTGADARMGAVAASSTGMRFYAGFPIESPDGYRIGALCVLDEDPHAADPAAAQTLRDLAKLVQRELARALAENRAPVPA